MLKGLFKDKVFIKGLVSGLLIAVLAIIVIYGISHSGKILEVLNDFSSSGTNVIIKEAEGGRAVDPGSNLTLSFLDEIAGDVQISETRKGPLIEFDPPIPHSYRWVDKKTLLILPEKTLKPSTNYQLKINSTFSGGSSLFNDDIILSFKTKSLNVESSKMYYRNKRVDRTDINLRIVFNYPVKPESLKKYLKIYLDDKSGISKETDYIIVNDTASRTVNILLEDLERGLQGKEMKINILPGLVSVNGTEGMSQEYIKKYTILPRESLKVERVYADINSEEGSIIIEFSEAVEEESAESFVSLKEDIDYRIKVYRDRIYLNSKNFTSGQLYTVSIRKGLPSEAELPLNNSLQRRVRIPDFDPLVHFTSPGFYLSSKGKMNLEMETVNVDSVDVRINKVFANNIVHFLHNSNNRSVSKVGKDIDSFTIDIENSHNKLISNTIYLGRYLSEQEKGIYQVNIHDHDYYWRKDSRFIIVTDIGITTKLSGNQLLIWVNSMKNLESIGDAKVSLVSYNNQVIASGRTDKNGLFQVKDINLILKEYRPYVVIVEYDKDFSFLKLEDGRIELADYDITGRKYLTEGYEAFIYSDRGVYRPGDKANIGMIVRGKQVSTPSQFPVNIKIDDPTGNTYRDISKKIGQAGEAFLELDLPSYVKTGKYSITASVGGKKIGNYSFNVEEFIPERIKVEIETDKEKYKEGEESNITVRGLNLFGPPAVGRNVKLNVRLDAFKFSPAGYSSYSFGEVDSDWKEITEQPGSGKLDENGEKVYKYKFPTDLKPGNMVKAVFEAEVMEDGGRSVSEYKVADFYPYNTFIGIKPLRDYYGKVNEKYPIDYIVLNSDGEKVKGRELSAIVYRLIRHGLWRRNDDGKWYYESDIEENKVFSKNITAENAEGQIDFTPTDYGRYKVVITDLENESTSSIYFYASGWGYSPWSLTNPDKVEITFNKDKYRTGEIAEIQLKTPFNGKAMVTVEREKVYDVRFVNIEENSALIDLKVKSDWKPNVYVSVYLIRSIDSVDRHSPVRAFGTAPLQVDCSENDLKIDIDNNKGIVRPDTRMKVGIEVPGGKDKPTYLTLAAVDEGILQLTDFKTPDPFAFFYGKKQLDVDNYDLYNLILPEVEQVNGKSSPSGGSYENDIRKQNLNPISANRVKPVSLFTGKVKLKNGRADLELDIPEFNGSIRLMALAFNNDSFGSTSKNIIVRNPIVLTPTYPRFLAPEDRFTIPVAVYNDTGSKGSFNVKMLPSGPVSIIGDREKTVELQVEEEKMVFFECKVNNETGKVLFNLSAEGNEVSVNKETELPVRPTVPYVNEIRTGGLTGEKKGIKFENKWLPGTESYKLTLSSYPTVKFAESLSYLLKYPYGCLEQTTSRVFPLLYFDDLARIAEPEMYEEGSADYYIQEGISKIQSMQQQGGSFSYWPGGRYSNTWATIYSSHFLVEARKAGYNVANFVYNRMIENLDDFVKREADSSYELQKKIYALYVLALADSPDISTMNYIKNHKQNQLFDDSRTMLAAAYYYTGKQDISDSLIRYSYNDFAVDRETGGNFNSNTRIEAVILSILADIDPEHRSIPNLVESLSQKAEIGRWGTTQDNAFAFMALGKAFSNHEDKSYYGSIYINDKRVMNFNSEDNLVLDDFQAGDEIRIESSGKGTAYYSIKSSGVPLNNTAKEEDSGIEIRRQYFDKEGNKIDLKKIKQGDMVIAKLSIRSYSGNLDNVVLVDMLPAGLEIENPRLGSRTKFSWIEDNNNINPEYVDIRDDRLLVFTNIKSNKTATFYYTMRAVTVGEFSLPPIKAECMYNPGIYSINGSGELQVIK